MTWNSTTDTIFGISSSQRGRKENWIWCIINKVNPKAASTSHVCSARKLWLTSSQKNGLLPENLPASFSPFRLRFPPIHVSNNGNAVLWVSLSLRFHPSDARVLTQPNLQNQTQLTAPCQSRPVWCSFSRGKETFERMCSLFTYSRTQTEAPKITNKQRKES